MRRIEFLSLEHADGASATPESVYLAGGTEEQQQTMFLQRYPFASGYNPVPGAAAGVTPKATICPRVAQVLLTHFVMRRPK